MTRKIQKIIAISTVAFGAFVSLIACGDNNEPSQTSSQNNSSEQGGSFDFSSVDNFGDSSNPIFGGNTGDSSIIGGNESSNTPISSEEPVQVVLTNIVAVNNKQEYELNEKLDITVTAFYSDGTSKIITNYQVSGFDSKNPGEQNVVVFYQGKTASFVASVKGPVLLTNIAVTNNKQEYEWGEELDITVTAFYSDGTNVTITDYQVSGFDSKNPGEQNVVITYQGQITSFKTLVKGPVLLNITVTSNKDAYEWGEELDLVVTASYSDGSTVEITDYQVDGYNKELSGEQDLVISYQGKSYSMKVSVNERINLFPAEKLSEFLQTEEITTTIPSPIGYETWSDLIDMEQDGTNFFTTTTKDEGTVGTDSIADQYALVLENAGWIINNSENKYVATMKDGDVELTFATENNEFSLKVESYSEFPDKKVIGSLVRSKTSLKDGDVVVLGSESQEFIVTDYENGAFNTSFCLFTDGGPDSVNKNVWRFKLNKSGTSWTLSDIHGRKLGATGVGQLAWDEGVTEWAFLLTSNSSMIMNANKDYGRLVYNIEENRLSTYVKEVSDENLVYPQMYKLTEQELIYPTSISLGGDNEVGIGKTNRLSVNFVPENSNTLGDIIWSSSDESIATVTGGVIKGISVGNVTITAKTKSKGAYLESSFNVEIKERVLDKWTIMLYICGADLESDNGLASADIQEILSVSNQPDDVNIIIETGGTTYWHKYGIDANALSRYHVENKALVLDEKLPKENMGKQSVFESFLNWGLEEYPAKKTGVVFWNHGGALDGVCFDSTVGSSNSLTNSETKAAFKNVFETNGLADEDRLEFVGYDACLMQVQDMAEFNSHYFNYMVGSEESEVGEGWVYSQWVDDVYAGKDTKDILKANCDAFVNSYGSDQTLAYLDLSKMGDYFDKFEAMAAAIKNTAKSNWNTFKNLLSSVKDYGSSNYGWWSTSGLESYGIIDGLDMLNKLSTNTTFSGFQNEINAAKDAFTTLVAYSRKGNAAGNSNGLAVVAPLYVSYPTSETAFTTWRSIFY